MYDRELFQGKHLYDDHQIKKQTFATTPEARLGPPFQPQFPSCLPTTRNQYLITSFLPPFKCATIGTIF